MQAFSSFVLTLGVRPLIRATTSSSGTLWELKEHTSSTLLLFFRGKKKFEYADFVKIRFFFCYHLPEIFHNKYMNL